MPVPLRCVFLKILRKSQLLIWCSCWLAALPFPAIAADAPPLASPPRVLVLNSYHPGYHWSDGELRGVLKVLRKEFSGFIPNVESMDKKREISANQAEAVQAFLLRKYQGIHFDLVITLDDAALEFALANRSQIAPDAPIVFGGVSHLDPAKFAPLHKITGVLEKADFVEALESYLHLRPATRTIHIMLDDTDSSQMFYRDIMQAAPHFADRLHFDVWQNWTAAELLQRAANLPQTGAIAWNGYVYDATGRAMSQDIDFIRALTAQSSVPIIFAGEPLPAPNGSTDLEGAVWQGIGGPILIGERHGEAVGTIAARVLRGEDAAQIPILNASPTLLAYDYPQLIRHQIDLDRLPPEAKVFNRPVGFFEVHRGVIFGSAGIILFLAGAIVLLLLNNLRRRRAELALRRSNERIEILLTAVDQATELIALLHRDGTVYYANPVFRRTLQPTDQTSPPTGDILWRDPAATPIPFARVADRATSAGRWHQRVTLVRPDQPTCLLEVIVTPIQSPSALLPQFLVIAQDVTQSARLEERVRLGQKMDALGTLAGGIAHDFNNILTAIVGNTELALFELPADHPTASLLTDIRKAADRATRLVRQILTFSRNSPPQREELCLTPTIKETLDFIRATVPAAISVRHTVNASPVIAADPTQIYQVLINLCTNATQAIGTRPGTLEVIEDAVEITPESLATHPELTPGPHLCITISDDGCGMSPEIIRRIFEPFYTTKAPGQGTGLGLAVVHGILKSHHAAITVSSIPDKGTFFRLYFPAITPTDPTPEEKAPAPLLSRGDGQHLILIDDEDAVTRTVTKTLVSLGYRVTTFSHPAAALTHLRQEGADTLITDLSMPEMNGLELVAQIRVFAPHLPVILISGYLTEADHARARQLAITQILDKPLTLAKLAHALADCFPLKG